MEIKTIMNKFYEQLYDNKVDNLDETDRKNTMIEMDTIKNKKMSIIRIEIRLVIIIIIKLPRRRSLGQNGFTGEFYQMFINNTKQMLFQKKKRKECFQITSMRPVFPWYQNETNHKKTTDQYLLRIYMQKFSRKH